MKVNLKIFNYIVSILIIGIIIYSNLKTKTVYNNEVNLEKKSIIIIKKKKCNIEELKDNSLFIKGKVKENKKNVLIKNNKKQEELPKLKNNQIIFKNRVYYYLGELNHKCLFKTYNNNVTKFFSLNIGDKLGDTNITLKANEIDKIIFEYNNNELIMKKSFVDINKYKPKENNETKN